MFLNLDSPKEGRPNMRKQCSFVDTLLHRVDHAIRLVACKNQLLSNVEWCRVRKLERASACCIGHPEPCQAGKLSAYLLPEGGELAE
jgi:hypothetical protein